MGNKSLSNKYLYKQFSNNPAELFDFTMTNVMDGFYDSSMSQAIDGSFKAVCLSGIKTGDNKGSGTGANDAVIAGDHVNLTVRPLTDFGNIMPDPRKYTDPIKINEIISLHSSTFLARSDDTFDVTKGVSFGQVVDCYFERGSVTNSDFQTLRFTQPTGVEVERSFADLATISGVKAGSSDVDFTNASVLGAAPGDAAAATAQGKCSNTYGTRPAEKLKYIVIHYSAGLSNKKQCLDYENRATPYGYHYMIDRDGSFFNTADALTKVQHSAGNSQVGNWNSVGICIMNAGYGRPKLKAREGWLDGKYPNNPSETAKWEPFTPASLDACAKICADLCKRLNIPVENIVGHSDIQKNKSDPGPAFGMASFRVKTSQKM